MADMKLFSWLKSRCVEILSRSNLSLWAKLHSGQYLKVDLSSSVGRSIYLRGSYEPVVEKRMREHLNPGDVFVDIGANVGYFTTICADIVGERGEVHSFDPHARVNRLLAESIARNGYKHVRLNRQALSDRVEELSFVALQNSAFSWTLPVDQDNRESVERVSAIPFDQYVSEHINRPISLIKIDVEGAEVNVLRGAANTLAGHSPTIILEAQDWSLARFGYSIDDLFFCLTPLGYRAYDLDGAAVAGADDARKHLEGREVQNLVFIKVNDGE